MITKYAALEKILEVKTSRTKLEASEAGQNFSKFAKLEDETLAEGEDGYLYVRARAISSRVNKNNDGWPSTELAGAYKTFIGRPVFVDHNNSDPKRTRGVVVDARLIVDDEDRDKIASLDPYYANAPDNHLPPTAIEIILEVDAKTFPKLANAIKNGHIDATSMGANIARSVCSVCANEATTPNEYCNHIKQKGMEFEIESSAGEKIKKRAYEDCYGVVFFEDSFVFDPADETALIGEHKDDQLLQFASKMQKEAKSDEMQIVDNVLEELPRGADPWAELQREIKRWQDDGYEINYNLAAKLMEEELEPREASLEKLAPGKKHVKGWSPKRNRQYEHILESCQKEHPNWSKDQCKELAARTVNKTRSEKNEIKSSLNKEALDPSAIGTGLLLGGSLTSFIRYLISYFKGKGMTREQILNEVSQDLMRRGYSPEEIRDKVNQNLAEFGSSDTVEYERMAKVSPEVLDLAEMIAFSTDKAPHVIVSELADDGLIDSDDDWVFLEQYLEGRISHVFSPFIAKVGADDDEYSNSNSENKTPQSEQVTAPQEVDTLRQDKECEVCKSDVMREDPDGIMRCPTCGHEDAPEPLDTPNLDESRSEDAGETEENVDIEGIEPIEPVQRATKKMVTNGVISDMLNIKMTTDNRAVADRLMKKQAASVDTTVQFRGGVHFGTYEAMRNRGLSAIITYPDGNTVDAPNDNPMKNFMLSMKAQQEMGFAHPGEVPITVEAADDQIDEVISIIHAGGDPAGGGAGPMGPGPGGPRPIARRAAKRPETKRPPIVPSPRKGQQGERIISDQLAPVESKTIVIDGVEYALVEKEADRRAIKRIEEETQDGGIKRTEEILEETGETDDELPDTFNQSEKENEETDHETEEESAAVGQPTSSTEEGKISLAALELAELAVSVGVLPAERKLAFLGEIEGESEEQLETRRRMLEMVKGAGLHKQASVNGDGPQLQRMPRLGKAHGTGTNRGIEDLPIEAVFTL